ncbi:MAG: helix-turn-helix domain-containing protein [bacterium]|nr:helix-turn-helix domain-containing protein [bacterium]
MNFAQNLQTIRTRNGLTQEQLAEELDVTRQSVSKWESGISFPEMETLLKICDRYGVGLDELLRGSVEQRNEEEAKGFVRHIKTFSLQMALAISAIIMALAVVTLLDGIASEQIMGVIFLTVVTASVITSIVSGMEHSRYVKKHPNVQPVCTEKEVERADRRFSWAIAGGVGLILFGLIVSSYVDDAYDQILYSNASGAVFLAAVAVAVGIFIFFGIRRSLYHVEEYNKENAREKTRTRAEKVTSAVSGVIMLLATCVFLVWGFWGMPGGTYSGGWKDYAGHWGISWIVFPVGGILCAVASIVIHAVMVKEEERDREDA